MCACIYSIMERNRRKVKGEKVREEREGEEKGGGGGGREREGDSYLKLLALGLLMVPSSSVMTKLLQLESV